MMGRRDPPTSKKLCTGCGWARKLCWGPAIQIALAPSKGACRAKHATWRFTSILGLAKTWTGAALDEKNTYYRAVAHRDCLC